MTNDETKIPIWYWVIAVIALLWNFMGLFAFYSDMTISEAALSAMTEAQRNLYETQPMWAKIAFGGAVILGTLGTLGLLLRGRWAKLFLVLSVVCVVVQMIHGFMSNSYEIMGSGAMVMGLVVLGFALFLVWFSRFADGKGYFK